MTHMYHNPFAGMDLIVPIEQVELYDRYCQTSGRAVIDHTPFPRKIDLWFAGLSLAARKEIKPIDLSKAKTSKFHEGSVLDSDNWRVQVVMLVAIAIEGGVEIVGEPRKMIAIANGLAAAGVPLVVEMLRDGDQDPIWNLSEAIGTMLNSANAQ